VVVVGDRVPDSFAPVQRQRATLSVVVWWWGQVKLKGSVTRVVISGADWVNLILCVPIHELFIVEMPYQRGKKLDNLEGV
jgi:hypothetical protein